MDKQSKKEALDNIIAEIDSVNWQEPFHFERCIVKCLIRQGSIPYKKLDQFGRELEGLGGYQPEDAESLMERIASVCTLTGEDLMAIPTSTVTRGI